MHARQQPWPPAASRISSEHTERQTRTSNGRPIPGRASRHAGAWPSADDDDRAQRWSNYMTWTDRQPVRGSSSQFSKLSVGCLNFEKVQLLAKQSCIQLNLQQVPNLQRNSV